MKTNKPKMENYQRVMVLIAWAFFAVAIILVILSFFDIVHPLLFALFYMIYCLLNRLTAWKQNPKMETLGIVFDAALLIITVVVLILEIL